jgi:hypothetical protein
MKTYSKTPILFELNQITPWSHIIFNKSVLVLSRTKGCKNHYYMLGWENFRIIIDQKVLKLKLTRVA